MVAKVPRPTPQKRQGGIRTLNPVASKDKRVTSCSICKLYIYNFQPYVWTRAVGFVHEEGCLERLKNES
jgi:Pyruvate/2-oxoacid:ferredoxin oxidoreductase delta subunit